MTWLGWFRKWPYTFILIVSLLAATLSVVAAAVLHIPLKDPEGFLGPAYIRLPALALIFFAVGILLAALDRLDLRHLHTLPKSVVTEVRTTWNWTRVLNIATGMFCFYVCYVSYRNLKSDLPVFRDTVHFDRPLAAIDDFLTAGAGPGPVLHAVLGTTFTAPLLSAVYLAYLPLIPISLGAFLVLVRDSRIGAWFTTTMCLNWVFGVASYYIVPALGPIYYRPEQYQDLPVTDVTGLQEVLFSTRLSFLSDPEFSGKMHGVAAFASLHVSVTFAAALFMERTNQRRFLRVITWVFFALVTVATIYFGWHYIADDLAGLLIGWVSVSMGAWATGTQPRSGRPFGPRQALPLVALGQTESAASTAISAEAPEEGTPPLITSAP